MCKTVETKTSKQKVKFWRMINLLVYHNKLNFSSDKVWLLFDHLIFSFFQVLYNVCYLHKTVVTNQYIIGISWIFQSCHLSRTIPVLVFYCQNNIIAFLPLSWQRRKTAAVYQRMIMVDEWDEDNELAPLERTCHEESRFNFYIVRL